MGRLAASLAVLTLLLPTPHGDPLPQPARSKKTGSQELLTKYLLSRLGIQQSPAKERSSEPGPDPLQKLLDHAKANIDVIDFSNPAERYSESDHLRFPRQPELYSTLEGGAGAERDNPAPSHTVPVFLPFPGAEHARPARAALRSVAPPPAALAAAPALPTAAVGGKQFYIGIFFKANWYRAEQYCRYHGMHLASVGSEAEQRDLQEHITSFGLGNEHFWSSGTDQAEEGKFFWMSTGKPITYENWNAGEPNNFQYENGETENCLELWNRDGKGLKWNDTPCSFESFFVCEA